MKTAHAQYPTISIITPCFNSENFLEETILSVLEQDYPNLEYIIIDGGSTDNSLEIIKRYQEKLTYWISENDQGMYDALQKGFEKSTGEIMAWINADDLYHQKSFFIVAEIFSKYTDVNWLVGASTQWDEYGRGINVDHSRKFSRYDFLMGDYKWLQQESCFFRRSLWDKAGAYIDKSLKYAGDFELWIRFFRYDKLYVVNALIGGFRIRSVNQLSLEGMPKYLEEANKILESEKITKKERKKIMRYKFIFSMLSFLYHFLGRLMNKYRKIELDQTNNIELNRFTQQFEAEKNSANYLRYIKGENIQFEWAKNIRDGMERAAGFFPASDENLEKFSLLMLECIPNVDILGSYWPDEIYVKDRIAKAKIVDLPDIEPYYHNNPWSRILKGKNVLVIHPFVETIKSQYLKRDKLFRNNDILPEFKLETIKAVQSIAYNDCGYKNWFDALEAMKFQITQKEYDIAIIGCGAYGFPLASFVKEQGKKAVHLGGATQVLFGIKGGRWDGLEFISKLYNEYWVRPSKEETPIHHKNVENGCYW